MEKITVEPVYFRFVEEDGSMSFIISPHDDKPESPRLLYDGRTTAVLYRRAGQTVALTKLDDLATRILETAATVTFVEPKPEAKNAKSLKDAVQSGQIEYSVPVRLVKKLPVIEENLTADSSLNPFDGKSSEEIGAFIDEVAALQEKG